MKFMACVAIVAVIALTAWAQEPPKTLGVQGMIVPDYPNVARWAKVSGKVRLTISVGASGVVTGITAASGPSILVDYAKKNIVHWSYTPIDMITSLEVVYDYRLEGPEVDFNTPSKVELQGPLHIVITANFRSPQQ